MVNVFLNKQEDKSIPEQNILIEKYLTTKDIKYRDEIIAANYKLIVSLVRGYTKNLYNDDLYNDMLSASLYEAITCLDRYELGKGNCTPISWIRTCVSNLLSNYVKNDGLLRMNTTYYNKIKLEQKLSELFYQKNGRYPIKDETYEYYDKSGEYCVHKFKDRVPITVLGDVMPVLSDGVEDTYLYEDASYVNPIISQIRRKLTRNERIVIDSFYYNLYNKNDIRFLLFPTNKKEEKLFFSRALNSVTICDGQDSQIYNVYYAKNNQRKRGKNIYVDKHFDEKLPKNINLYTKRGIYIFRSTKPLDVIYNKSNVEPIFKRGIYTYKLYLDNIGHVHRTNMTIYNIHSRIISKLKNIIK